MTGNQIYLHPDGPTIHVLDRILTVADSDGKTASVPIGEIGLVELGERLVAIGQALIVERGTAQQDEKLLSERAGAAMGVDLVDELFALRSKPQAQAFCALHEKLLALSKLAHFDSAAGGFAGAVINLLEVGVDNLSTFEQKEQ